MSNQAIFSSGRVPTSIKTLNYIYHFATAKCTLYRIWGEVAALTGSGPDYIQLFDTVPSPTTTVTYATFDCGAVTAAGQVFSLDISTITIPGNSPCGLVFQNGIWIALSTTPDIYTADTSGELLVNWQLSFSAT